MPKTLADRLQLYPLVRVAAALAAGIVAGDTLGYTASSLWLTLVFVAAVAVAAALYICAAGKTVQTVAILVGVAAGGALRMNTYIAHSRCTAGGEAYTYTAVVATPVTQRGNAMRCELIIASGSMAGRRVYAYMPARDTADMPKLSVGDGIAVRSHMHDAADSTAAGTGSAGVQRKSHFSYRRWLSVHGIVGRTYLPRGSWRRANVSLVSLPGIQRVQLKCTALRNQILARYRTLEPSTDAYAVVAAMTLGDKSAISPELRESYSAAGASHILALSGLHLSILYTLLTTLTARRRRNGAVQLAVLATVWGYVLLAGMPLSLLRSAVMFSMLTLTSMALRANISANTLALAAILLLVASPSSLWDAGFQLSFLAVSGIIAFRRRVFALASIPFGTPGPVMSKLLSFISVSISAQLAVAPLVAYYFGNISLCFLLSNAIAIPLATLLVYLSAVMYALFFAPCLQGCVAGIVGMAASALNRSLSWVASLPGASISGIDMSLAQLLLSYAAIVLLYMLLTYAEKMYKPA